MAHLKSTGTKTTPKKVSSTTGQEKTSSTTSARTAKKLSQNLTTLTTNKSESKKPSKVSSTKKTAGTEVIISHDLELFPYVSGFPFRLIDKTEKKTCYFQSQSHAQKYIDRYHPVYDLYRYIP